ncbi:MAG: hypothetical protein IJ186_01955 [Bacilli bacterium]|nr:hypothetical protein [Bacilli bacterium]
MEKQVVRFEYKEYGLKEKVRSYTIMLEDEHFVFVNNRNNKTYILNKDGMNEIFAKYDFKDLTVSNIYPFKVKEQIDYEIKIYFEDNHDMIEINGYSHFPDFYNEFINDISKLIPNHNLSSLKVKDEMLDKDKKYITNYIEKVTINTKQGIIVIPKDRLGENEYDIAIDVFDLNKYYKKEDLNFVLPVNVHYFTYLFNKLCNFGETGDKKNSLDDEYIDIRLHNKKHRYFDLNLEKNQKSLQKLIIFLKMYSKIEVLDALINPSFVENFEKTHALPKTKSDLNREFLSLINDKKMDLVDALIQLSKNNPNFSMYDLISIAYMNQENYFVYIIDKAGKIHEEKIDADNEKKLNKYFKVKEFDELKIISLSDKYDALVYRENGEAHINVISSQFEDLEFLQIDKSLLSVIE